MIIRLLWFLVGGFILGFMTSWLWEWLYYRQKRLRWESRRVKELEEQVHYLRSHQPQTVSSETSNDESARPLASALPSASGMLSSTAPPTRYGSQDYTSLGALTKDEQEGGQPPIQADHASTIEAQPTTQIVNQGIDTSIATQRANNADEQVSTQKTVNTVSPSEEGQNEWEELNHRKRVLTHNLGEKHHQTPSQIHAVDDSDLQTTDIPGFQVDAFTQRVRQDQNEHTIGEESAPGSIVDHRRQIHASASSDGIRKNIDDNVDDYEQGPLEDQEDSAYSAIESSNDLSSPNQPNQDTVNINKAAHNQANPSQISDEMFNNLMRNSAKSGQRQFSTTSVNPNAKINAQPEQKGTLSAEAIERQSDELSTMIDEYSAQHRRPLSNNRIETIGKWTPQDDPEIDEREYQAAVITLDDVLHENAVRKQVTEASIQNHPDVLSIVPGIGRAYQEQLYTASIYTWSQLAETSIEALQAATSARPNDQVTEWPTEARKLAQEHHRENAVYEGPPPDILTKIPGIGDISAQMLHQSGVWTYAKLAKFEPSELIDTLRHGGISLDEVKAKKILKNTKRLLRGKKPK
ncbi:hypothetical protein KFU94_10640 [Chloroflexi bacterium TSY]|nr:hypothetical protein [Chloroflexi bacterium TSY]